MSTESTSVEDLKVGDVCVIVERVLSLTMTSYRTENFVNPGTIVVVVHVGEIEKIGWWIDFIDIHENKKYCTFVSWDSHHFFCLS